MKLNRIFFGIAAVAILSASCKKEETSEKQKMDERIAATTVLDVKYEVLGEQTKSIGLNAKHHELEVKVSVNDPNLRWTIESDRDWCVVDGEQQKGSGKFRILVAANESFEERDEATLTFVAGVFSGFQLKVNQNASTFLISQPWLISPKSDSTFTVKVTVPKNTEWSVENESWTNATKGGVTYEDDEQVVSELNVAVIGNDSDSRFGKITLVDDSTGTASELWITQLGTEYNYDAEGNIWFENDEDAVVEFLAPSKTIKTFVCPKYMTAEYQDLDSETVKVILKSDKNYTDCAEIRVSTSYARLTNTASTRVDLPAISQDYLAAGGLLTGKGMMKFAEAIATGGDISSWQKDGVVTVMQDIDMDGYQGWTGIGTEDKPFTGTFDGGKYKIKNLKKSRQGLFAYTRNATVKNVIMDETCSLYDGSTGNTTDIYMGGIVGKASKTTIEKCEYNGIIECGAKTDAGSSICFGGIAGYFCDTTTINACKVNGDVFATSTNGSAATLAVGGIAGKGTGSLKNCEFAGTIDMTSGVSNLYIGGVLGYLEPETAVGNNSGLGEIVCSGGSLNECVGGIYGYIDESVRVFDFASDKSVAMSNITVKSFYNNADTRLMVGGFVGKIAEAVDVSFKGYEINNNIIIGHTTALKAAYVCVGGLLGGCDPDGAATSVKIDNVANRGFIKFDYNAVVNNVSQEYAGGIAGYILGPCEIKNSRNEGNIGDAVIASSCAKSNAYCQVTAGIAAWLGGGNAVVSNCVNNANIVSVHYNNQPYNYIIGDTYRCNVQSGIIGVFDYFPTPTGITLNLSNCQTSGYVQGYRGISAGIIGYASKATISKCSAAVNMDGSKLNGISNQANASAYKAGIAGCLINSQISDCDVKGAITASSPGSTRQNPAGILSVDYGGSSVSGCSSYTTITATSEFADGAHIGGLVAFNTETTSVTNCRYGGSVNGTKVNDNNVESLATGVQGTGTLSGITYWDGN